MGNFSFDNKELMTTKLEYIKNSILNYFVNNCEQSIKTLGLEDKLIGVIDLYKQDIDK